MVVQPSEVADLVMMVVLGPIILIAVRRALPASIVLASIALALMATGYVGTVLEGFLLPEFFNLVEHASYAFAGIMFVWLLLFLRGLLGHGKAGRQ